MRTENFGRFLFVSFLFLLLHLFVESVEFARFASNLYF